MAVKYPQGGGGGGFNPFGILSTLGDDVPGGQAIAPWIAGCRSFNFNITGTSGRCS